MVYKLKSYLKSVVKIEKEMKIIFWMITVYL